MQVVLPDYRLAPEHPCPAAIDDVLAVIGAIRDRPLVLFGDSAGANISLACAIAGAPASMLSLAYGCFGPVFDTASHRECGDGRFGLSTERMRWFWNNWQGGAQRPARGAAERQAFRACRRCTCSRPGSIACATTASCWPGGLASAGVPFRLDVMPGVVHGFLQMSSRLGPSRDAIAMLAREIELELHHNVKVATMTTTMGSGDYRYEAVENWAKLPPGWSFKEIGSVGVRPQRQCLRLQPRRAPDDRVRPRRQFPEAPGARASFPRAHGLHMAPDDTLWLTDDGDHTVRQCTLDGKVLLTLGIPGKPAPYMSGEPFHRCTHTALSPQGRHLRLRRLRQFARAQIRAGRQAAEVLGRPGHRSRRVQHRAQHHLRRRRLGLRRRPREPSRAGVRRQRPLRDAVEQSAPSLRAVHAAGQVPGLLYRRAWARACPST